MCRFNTADAGRVRYTDVRGSSWSHGYQKVATLKVRVSIQYHEIIFVTDIVRIVESYN